MSENQLSEIINKYDTEELMYSSAYRDGGVNPLWGRFERAAINQMEGGDATCGRYGIWANTVHGNIEAALASLDADNLGEAKRLLIRAANSMAAFADLQRLMEPNER